MQRRRIVVSAGRAAVALGLLGVATAVRPAGPARVPDLELMLPPPGSYRLERIMRVPDGTVIDSDGSAHSLARLTTGKVTLFSFIYTYCTDPKGCPLAYETMHRVKQAIETDPRLRNRVRFVSMSFDPDYDTPEAMRSYGGQDARDRRGLRWHFLTTSSRRELRPVLEGFGQDVSILEAGGGQRPPVLQHMLKVFLIDAAGQVREIYTTSFLHPAVLLNDIRTLLLERRGQE